jgi:hypothetical protein
MFWKIVALIGGISSVVTITTAAVIYRFSKKEPATYKQAIDFNFLK